MYSRAHIRCNGPQETAQLVSLLNTDGTTNKYILETADSAYRVNARSFLGAVYFTTEHADDTWLVNTDNDGWYPTGIDNFRI